MSLEMGCWCDEVLSCESCCVCIGLDEFVDGWVRLLVFELFSIAECPRLSLLSLAMLAA